VYDNIKAGFDSELTKLQADLDSAEKEAQQEESSCHYYDTLSAGLRAAQKIAGNAGFVFDTRSFAGRRWSE